MSEWGSEKTGETAEDGHWLDVLVPAGLGLATGIMLHIMMGIGGFRPTIPHFVEVTTITLWFLWSKDRAIVTIVFALLLGLVLALPLEALYVPREGSYETAFWHAGYWRYLTSPFVVYVAITFFKAMDGGRILRPSHKAFFDNQIRLPVLVGLGAVFSVIIWGLMFLWAEMFTIIEIDFIQDMLQERWFYLPFSWTLGGLSIALVRGWSGFVKIFRDLIFMFCRIAAPLIAFFAVTFLFALPFSGLEPLWKTPSAAGMTGAITFILCIIINCVRQDGEGMVPQWLRWSVVILILTAPFYGAISAHAVWLRIDQYGFTPERMINGALVMVILVYCILCVGALFASAMRKTPPWLALYAPINITAALVLGAIFLLFHTPVADPLAISARSQLARLVNGDIAPDDFEPDYLRFHLGRPGEAALMDLKANARFSGEQTLQRNIHIALNTTNMSEYNEGRSQYKDVVALKAGESTIYEMPLARMRFYAGDYGVELLLQLAQFKDHPDAATIRVEAVFALAATAKSDYWTEWRVKAIKMRFVRREASLRDIRFDVLYCSEEEGEKALIELRQMTDHPDYEALLVELTYLETTDNVKRCQQRYRERLEKEAAGQK